MHRGNRQIATAKVDLYDMDGEWALIRDETTMNDAGSDLLCRRGIVGRPGGLSGQRRATACCG
jgi:hypothetical protein